VPGTKSYRAIIFLFILMAGYSCSVEKNTSLSRFFHNLSSNYNIYFNGYESYREGIKRISESNRDDYSTIMPLFEYSNPDAIRSASSNMDRAIQKASKVISLHSMTAKPEMKDAGQMNEKEKAFYARKEYNNWVDDSYLLMGKAQLCKHEFDDARITFLHNIRETDDENIRYESIIWLARTYSELANFSEALRLTRELNPNDLPPDLIAQYYLTIADVEVKQARWSNAINPLTSAIDYLSGNKKKNRYTYILARLHEESGNQDEASRYYRELLRLSPSYEMEFNARINQAGVFDVESGDIDEMKKGLNKLLKDVKNKEYHDQIYFALGNLSMREGNVEEAIRYFHLSASASTVNQNQKGRSYLTLAEYYFNKYDYMRSQIYYDSAAAFLDNTYPGYDEFYGRSLSLNELAGFMGIVEREDSLQYVASLPQPQRDAIINEIIRKVQDEEQNAANELDTRYNMGEFYENQRRFRDDITASGKWYFYNQAALTFGRSEFVNRWGQRKLEHNWRRANKSRIGLSGQTDLMPGGQSDTAQAVIDRKSPAFYLKELPLTDSLLSLSNESIATSLFNSGRVFKERLNDNIKANEQYSELLARFPDHLLVPQALYNLCNLNNEINPALADIYKSRLINDYPDSEFAVILTDPEYFNTKLMASERAGDLYNEAYTAWENDSIAATISLCNSALSEFPDNDITPKFMLLRAYALAREVDERTLKEELNRIVRLYPQSDESRRAGEIVAYLNREVPELQIEDDRQIASEIYSTDTTGTYIFILIAKSRTLDINRLTFDVINFNIDNYTNENYSSRGELINNDHIRISVSPFKTRSNAMTYYRSFNPDNILSNVSDTEILTFIITPANLVTLGTDKGPDRYNLFFIEHYLDQDN